AMHVIQPERREISSTFSTSGTLRAIRSAQIRPQQSGIVLELKVEEGQRVEDGEVLAMLDTKDLHLAAARDRLAAENAAQELQRLEGISHQDAIARQEIEQARYEAAAAKATSRVSRHQASLGRITAPFAGTITSRGVDIGNLATSTTILFELADMSALELDLYAPELDASTIPLGAPVTLALVDGTTFVAQIRRRAPIVDAMTGTVKLTARIDDPTERAVPGAYVKARVARETKANALTVPLSATVEIGGAPYVFIVEDGVAKKTAVTLGITEEPLVEITSGLNEGHAIIADPDDELEDGMAVKPMGIDQPAAENALHAAPNEAG
ncbi:MAG: efflux RND transporter periplasmic adaptor subunit, partial [Nannocystaceae bacterium]